MSISINYILDQEKKKKKQEQEQNIGIPTHPDRAPTALQEKYEQNSNVLEQKYDEGENVQQQQQQEPTATTNQQAEAQNWKPEGWSDEDYSAVRQLYSDDEIKSIYQEQPNVVDGIASRIYRETAPKPKQLDEKQMKRQRNIAAIGDALSLFSQAAGAAQGAHVRERKFEEGAMGRLSDRQQQLYDRYLQQSDQYNRGLVNAQMKDYLQGKKDWKDTQKGIARTLKEHRDNQIKEAKEAQRAAEAEKRFDQTERRLDQSDRRIKNQEQQAEFRNNIARAREARLERQYGHRGGTREEEIGEHIVISANPNDPDAENSDFGGKIRRIPISKEEQSKLIRDAQGNEEFLSSHPEFTTTLGGSLTRAEQQEMLAAYVEYLYNQKILANPNAKINKIKSLIGDNLPDVGLPPPIQTGTGEEIEDISDPIGEAVSEIEQKNEEINIDDEFEIVY